MDALTTAVLIEGILTIGLAVVLVWRGLTSATALVAAFMIGGFGVLSLIDVATRVVDLSAGAQLAASAGQTLLLGAVIAAETLFSVLYPRFKPRGWRGWVAGFAAFALLGSVVHAAALLVAGEGGLHRAAVVLVGLQRTIVLLIPVTILGFTFLSTRGGALRTQIAFALLPFLVWAVNHIVLFLVAPARYALPSVSFVAGLVGVAILIAIGAGTLRDAFRNERRRGQDLFVVGWILLMVPLAFLQFLDFLFHFLVDGLMVVVLFYGIARYQIMGVDLRFKTLAGRGVAGALAVPLFFIAQQAIETTTSRALGVAGGIVAAGLGLFFLQLGQDRLLGRSPAGGKDLAGYEAYRRLEIYRTALEGVFEDGVADVDESRTLSLLRERLGINTDEHEALLADVRAVRA